MNERDMFIASREIFEDLEQKKIGVEEASNRLAKIYESNGMKCVMRVAGASTTKDLCDDRIKTHGKTNQ